MKHLECSRDGITLCADVTCFEEDICIIVYGGKAHVGSSVIAVPRESLAQKGKISCTSSVMNVTGHKDEFIVRKLAEEICVFSGRICSCTGGFHIDDIDAHQLSVVEALTHEMTERIKETIR